VTIPQTGKIKEQECFEGTTVKQIFNNS